MSTSPRRALLIAALASPALGAPINTLVSPAAPNAAIEYARRSALTSIDADALRALGTPRAGQSLELDLLGRPASLVVRRTESHGSGAVSIFARFEGAPDSSAVITTYDGFVSARLEHPDLGAFTIEPTPLTDAAGAPLHRVNEIDPAGFLPCATNDLPDARIAHDGAEAFPGASSSWT